MKFNQNDVLDAQLFMTAIVIINKQSFTETITEKTIRFAVNHMKR